MSVQSVHKQSLGSRGEKLARDYLERLGWEIIGMNVRVGRHKEIDLLAREGTTIVFVEVKTRTSEFFGSPEEAITTRKLARLQNAMAFYIQKNPSTKRVRLDVISILYSNNSSVRTKLKHIRAVGGTFAPVMLP